MNTLKRIAAITVIVLSTNGVKAQTAPAPYAPIPFQAPIQAPQPIAPIVYPGTFPAPVLQPMQPIQPVGGGYQPIGRPGYGFR